MAADGSRRRSVTIEDVAREAGVSRAAVSKVIRNAPGASAAMRDRVNAAITALNYRPSVAARAMRGSSYTLGLEIPHIGNPFLIQIFDGAREALAGTPYQLILAPSRARGTPPSTRSPIARSTGSSRSHRRSRRPGSSSSPSECRW